MWRRWGGCLVLSAAAWTAAEERTVHAQPAAPAAAPAPAQAPVFAPRNFWTDAGIFAALAAAAIYAVCRTSKRL